MENKAQVSFEYLVIISLIVILSSLTMVLIEHYFTISGSLKETSKTYANNTLNMLR